MQTGLDEAARESRHSLASQPEPANNLDSPRLFRGLSRPEVHRLRKDRGGAVGRDQDVGVAKWRTCQVVALKDMVRGRV